MANIIEAKGQALQKFIKESSSVMSNLEDIFSPFYCALRVSFFYQSIYFFGVNIKKPRERIGECINLTVFSDN